MMHWDLDYLEVDLAWSPFNGQAGYEEIDCSEKQTAYPSNTMIRGQPAEVREQFLQAAGHPKATYRVARAPQGSATVQQGYREFLALWRNPDPDRPEVAIAKEFLAKLPAASEIQTVRTSALTDFPNQLRWS